MLSIRRASEADVSRIAEIIITNYRVNFYPIFQDDAFYFDTLQVGRAIEEIRNTPELLEGYYVCTENGIIKATMQITGQELVRLFVEPVFQSRGIGEKMLEYAVSVQGCTFLWALEKNTRGIAFYERHGFRKTDVRKREEDTEEYLVKLVSVGNAKSQA